MTSLRNRWDASIQALVADLISTHKSDDSAQQTPSHQNENTWHETSLIWFEKVQTLYNEPHRAYHNWTHVQDVLTSLDFLMNKQQSMELTPTDVAITTLAAFFHDVIYNPKSSTNEKDSADLFLEMVKQLHQVISPSTPINNSEAAIDNSQITQKVTECILATASHITSAKKANASNNTIVSIFLDADISILGKPMRVYDIYAGCIREEYNFVERSVYCTKRAEILDSFLPLDNNSSRANGDTLETSKKHTHVFATEVGRSKWEENARCNLKREIELLRRGVIPLEGVD